MDQQDGDQRGFWGPQGRGTSPSSSWKEGTHSRWILGGQRLGQQEFLLAGDRAAPICLCPQQKKQKKPHGSSSSSIPNKASLYPAAFCSHGTEVSGKGDLLRHKQTSGMLPVIPLPSKSAVVFKAPLNDLFPKKTPV